MWKPGQATIDACAIRSHRGQKLDHTAAWSFKFGTGLGWMCHARDTGEQQERSAFHHDKPAHFGRLGGGVRKRHPRGDLSNLTDRPHAAIWVEWMYRQGFDH